MSVVAIKRKRAHGLTELEQVIADGLQSYVESGAALAKIRDGELYKTAGFETFETYCAKRWGMHRRHAYRLIDASAVVSNWSHELPPPANEAQARELARLKDPEEQVLAWTEVVETAPDGVVTAKWTAEVVARRLPAKAQSRDPEPDDWREDLALFALDKAIRDQWAAWDSDDVEPFALKLEAWVRQVREKANDRTPAE